jgi:hypothetical protein
VNQQATARQRDHGPGKAGHGPGKAAQGSGRVKVMEEKFGTYYAGNAASPGSATMTNTRFSARINATN